MKRRNEYQLTFEQLENRVVPSASQGAGLIPEHSRDELVRTVSHLTRYVQDGRLRFNEVKVLTRDARALSRSLGSSLPEECQTALNDLIAALRDATKERPITPAEVKDIGAAFGKFADCLGEHAPGCREELDKYVEDITGALEAGKRLTRAEARELARDARDLLECLRHAGDEEVSQARLEGVLRSLRDATKDGVIRVGEARRLAKAVEALGDTVTDEKCAAALDKVHDILEDAAQGRRSDRSISSTALVELFQNADALAECLAEHVPAACQDELKVLTDDVAKALAADDNGDVRISRQELKLLSENTQDLLVCIREDSRSGDHDEHEQEHEEEHEHEHEHEDD